MSSLQFNHLAKTSRARESAEKTEVGVQIALDEVDHFTMQEETTVIGRIAHLARPTHEGQMENRTGFLRLWRIQISKNNDEVAV